MTAASPTEESVWNKTDWQIVSALFVATFLSRIPFRTTLFYAWDSVLYARAIDHFDVSLHQPHAPGHIFYVFLSRTVNLITGDPNSAMVWVSVFFAAAAVAALYWLGTMMFSRHIGLVAALLLATSLSFWAYSEVAYPYTLLAFLVTVFSGLIYAAREGNSTRLILLAALFLGIGSGFRQDILPFMLPLMAYGLSGMPWRRWVASAMLLGVGVASWYLPSALFSGGFTVYRESSSDQSNYIVEKISVFGRGLDAIAANLHDLGYFSLMALAAATPLLLI
ncbi:MAG: glycosyltransferase family 39 protein, partial [Thermoleophilia bacterium]